MNKADYSTFGRTVIIKLTMIIQPFEYSKWITLTVVTQLTLQGKFINLLALAIQFSYKYMY